MLTRRSLIGLMAATPVGLPFLADPAAAASLEVFFNKCRCHSRY